LRLALAGTVVLGLMKQGEVRGRVDVHEHPPRGIEAVEDPGWDLQDAAPPIEFLDLKPVAVEQGTDRGQAAARIDRMQGLEAVGGGRDHDIVSGGLQCHVFEKGPVEKRHVAGRDEGVFPGGVEESCVEAPERPFPRQDIGNDDCRLIEVIPGSGRDDDDFGEDLAQQPDGPIDEALAFHP
jgi:hypothetical protein